jgi:hypothetical protein
MPATDFGSEAPDGALAVVEPGPFDVDAAPGRLEDACGPRNVACAVARPEGASSMSAAIHLNPKRLIDRLTALRPQQNVSRPSATGCNSYVGQQCEKRAKAGPNRAGFACGKV